MARRKCGIESCDELAEFIDDMDNYVCEDHMEQSIEEDGKEAGDFDSLSSLPEEFRYEI